MLLRTLICLTFFAFSGISYAKVSFWPTENARFDSLSLLMEEVYHQKNQQQLREIISSMYAVADEADDKTLLSYAKYWDIRNSLSQNIERDAILIDEEIASIDSVKNPYIYNRFMFLKAHAMYYRNDYVNAYRTYEEVISYFKSIKDTLSLAEIYTNEGVLMYRLGFYEEALELYKNANDFFEKKNQHTIAIKNKLNIYNILLEQGKDMLAYRDLEQLIDDPTIQQDTLFLINAMLSLFFYATDDSSQIKYAEKAYELAKQKNHPKLLHITLANKANMHLQQSELDSAYYYIKMVYDYALENNYLTELMKASETLASYHNHYSRPDSVLYYMEKFWVCKDSIYSLEKISNVHKIQAQAVINNYQEQLRFTKEKAKYEKQRTWLTALFILSLAVLVCVILWFRWRKTRIEKRIKELENRELNNQLDYKNRELTTRTLMLNEKNNTLREIKHDIDNLNLSGQISRKDKNQLEERINECLQSDDEWEYVKQHFESVHPGFFTRLKTIAPTLSENDLRICVYIRMGISSKEMARLLGVLPESINQDRYRIRKKFSLEGDVVLENFLREI